MLADLHQSGSSKVLFPRPAGRALEVVALNTAGGVTGGDEFSLDLCAGPGTEITLTTQACERAYRAQPGETARIDNRVEVAAGARVNWLPQETLLFEGAALQRRLRCDLQGDARLLLVEPLIFGRAAMGEVLRHLHLRDRVEVWRDGRPLYLDALRFDGDVTAHLAQAFTGGGAGAMAQVVFVGPEAAAHLNSLRKTLPQQAGVSLIGPDLLVLRLLGADGYDLRQVLLPVLRELNKGALPRCWMI